MLDGLQLNQLREKLTGNHKCGQIEVKTEGDETGTYLWVPVDKREVGGILYEVYQDAEWGWMALFADKSLLDTGYKNINGHKVLVLDKDQHPVDRFIWC